MTHLLDFMSPINEAWKCSWANIFHFLKILSLIFPKMMKKAPTLGALIMKIKIVEKDFANHEQCCYFWAKKAWKSLKLPILAFDSFYEENGMC